MDRLLLWSHAVQSGRASRMMTLAVGMVCLLGALALAGCGVTTTTSVGGGAPGSGAPNPGGPLIPAGSPSVSQGGPITGTTVRPCVGSTAAPEKTPTIVLTAKNARQTTQAHVGDVIEIDLSDKMRWNSPNVSANGTLTPLQPQGGMDQQAQTCRWVYQASALGTVTLSYTGVFICESGAACPAVAEDEEFTIHVG